MEGVWREPVPRKAPSTLDASLSEAAGVEVFCLSHLEPAAASCVIPLMARSDDHEVAEG